MSIEINTDQKEIDLDLIKKKRDAVIIHYKELNLNLPEKERLNSFEMKIIRSSVFNTLAAGFQVKDFKTIYDEIKTGNPSSDESYEIKQLNLINGDDNNLIFGWGSTKGSIYNIDGKIDKKDFFALFPQSDKNTNLKIEKINNIYLKIRERIEDREVEQEQIKEIYKRIINKEKSKQLKIKTNDK